MKLFVVLSFFFSLETIACEIVNPIRRTNPDGSVGGLVSREARVSPEAYIGKDARVCDRAWVDAKAELHDYSTVKENAWIREYTVVKDRASIGGEAVVWGTKNAPVSIGENSKIYGRARILTGTKVSGNAEIYGSVSLQDSSVAGAAKVCQNFRLANQNIFDDYFCNSQALSKIEISLEGIDVQKFNPKISTLRIRPLNVKFSPDPNVYFFTLNGKEVDSEKVHVSRSGLSLNLESDFIDGYNTLTINGRDEHGKNIDISDIKFVMGSGTKSIPIYFETAETSMKFNVKYQYGGETYTGAISYNNGFLDIANLPQNISNVSIAISGVGEKNLVLEEYKSIESLPASISAYSLPEFVNNNGDFSDNFESWKKSHPENISVESESGSLVAKIVGDDFERVEVSKRFKLDSDDAGLSLDSILPDIPSLFVESLPTIEIAIVSLSDKSFYRRTYEINGNTSKNKTDSIFNESNGGDFIVYIRLNPSTFLKYPLSPLILTSASREDFFLYFAPYHLNAKNVYSTKGAIPLTYDPLLDCNDEEFDVGNNVFFNSKVNPLRPEEKMVDENFNFFSAGNPWSMLSNVTMNRIYGKYRLYTNKDFRITEGPTLIIAQNGIIKLEYQLDRCAALDINSSSDKNSYDSGKNLVKNLFSIPFMDTVNNFNLLPGSRVSLFLKAKVSNSEDTVYQLSNEIDVPILVASPIEKSFWYGKLDHYDSHEENMLRTGGDKWILPYYNEVVSNIVWTTSPGWLINDISKANGGNFPGHKSHTDGLDVDFSTPGFNLTTITNDASWKDILGKIENFLNANQQYYNIIEEIYLSRNKPLGYHELFIDGKLNNRCFGDESSEFKRYVSFHDQDKDKSLLQHVPNHWNHLHVRFKKVSESSGLPILEPIQAIEYDLDDAWFELTDGTFNGQPEKFIKIYPRNQSSFPSNVSILWRFQETEDFDAFNLKTQLGRWPGEASSSIDLDSIYKKKKQSNVSTKHLYVVFADTKTGNCVQRYVTIELDSAKKLRRWSYKNKNGVYLLEGSNL